MILQKPQSLIFYFILLLFIVGCGENFQEQNKMEPQIRPSINQISLNGKIIIPFEVYDDSIKNQKNKVTLFYEYSISENNLKKTDITLPKGFIGCANLNDLLYIATGESIASYKLNEQKLERQNYLPTPKGDLMVACFVKDNVLKTITTSSLKLNIWTWDAKKWVLEKSFTGNKNNIPKNGLTSLFTATDCYFFWENEKITCFINLADEKLQIKETHIKDLSNICVWQEKENINISGFNEKFELIHYQLTGLNSPNLTSIKISLGEYPPFATTPKIVSLLPIQIGNELKGFVYGSIDNVPVWISAEKKEFPKALVIQAEQKIISFFYQQLGVLVGAIFLFSILAWKISSAWEQRLSYQEISQNSIFFGPTLHRGMAFFIDVLLILLITHFTVFYLPENLSFYTEATKLFSSGVKVISLESDAEMFESQIPFLLTGYLVNLVYGTLSEFIFGCTLGKYCLGLKVYSDKRLKKLNLFQAISRNLIPKFPPIMPIILFSNITISLTERKKSLNDYAGNTVVLYNRLHKRLNLNIINSLP